MSKLITVVGATGNQGASVIDALVASKAPWKIRAVTRNASSDKAKALASRGIEVVSADLNDESSLVKAFEGTAAIYAITDFFEPFSEYGPEKATEIESTQGINIAKAAAKTTSLEHLIWSSLANLGKISDGKWKVPHFHGKNLVDEYIWNEPKLAGKTTILWVTFYHDNLNYPMYNPTPVKSSGKYVWFQNAPADTPITVIGDTRKNVGIFVREILAHHPATVGKYVLAEVESTTYEGFIQSWGRATGKEVTYAQVSTEDYVKFNLAPYGLEMGIMNAAWADLRDKSWTAERPVVTRKELGISSEELVGLDDAFRGTNWNHLL